MPTILVVDDDKSTRSVLRKMLGRIGYDAVLCGSAEEAAGVMATRAFDALLLDLYLPGMDGLTFLRQVHRDHGPIPTVLLSGAGEMHHALTAIRLSAVDFLQKPVDDETLKAALGAATKERAYLSCSAPQASPASEPTPSEASTATAASAATNDSHGHGDGDSRGGGPRPRGAARLAPRIHAALKRVESRIRAGETEVPVLDARAARVHELIKEPSCGVDDVIDLVGRDQTLAGTCLRAANSSAYGTGRSISSLRQACVQLGNRRVLAFALEAVTRAAFVTTRQPYRDILSGQWRNALVTARVLERLAPIAYRANALARMALPDPEELYVAGLLHNVGELLLLQLLSGVEDLDATSDEDVVAIGEAIHARHEAFGRRLALRWGLPMSITRLAGAHHHPMPGKESRADRYLRLLLLAAWAVALEGGHVYLPAPPPPSASECLAAIGVDPALVAPMYDEMGDWLAGLQPEG